MTKSEAIHRRVLRCRPGHSNAYVTTHEALLAEAEYLQQTEEKINTTGLLHPLLVIGVCIAFLTLGWFA